MPKFRPYRKDGEEQPHIPAGIFKIRIPFYHWKWAWPEGIQGVALVAVALAAVPFIMEGIGASAEVAVLMVFLFSMLYMLHPTLGDSVFPGWITAGIPLVLAHLLAFEAGAARVHALIALQMIVAFLFIFLGITGLAKKVVTYVPVSVRSGILMGAAMAAIFSVVNPDTSRLIGIEISGIIGILVCVIVLYSLKFAPFKHSNFLTRAIAKSGMLAGMIVAMIVGVIIGELPMPQIQGGLSPLPFRELFDNFTIFGIGFPAFSYFVSAAPLAILLYLIAFGEIVVTQSVIEEAAEIRTDEHVDYNVNRTNIIIGMRNGILAFIAPYVPLAGPNWIGGTVSTVERYKQGKQAMNSLHDGISSFILAMGAAALARPLVTLLEPVFPIAMLITMLLTGFACGYVAMNMAKTREEQGIAAIMGVTIFAQGAAIGLITGVVLHILVTARNKKPMRIETERLILRRFRPDDWEDLLQIAIAKESSPFADCDHAWPTDAEGIKGACNWFAKDDKYWAVESKEMQKVVCFVNFNFIAEEQTLDIGHVVNTDYLSLEYEYEAMKALFSYAFSRLGAERIKAVWALADEEKLAPLQKLGMKITETSMGNKFRPESDGSIAQFEGCVLVVTKKTWLSAPPEQYF